jgi:hypothetical protein
VNEVDQGCSYYQETEHQNRENRTKKSKSVFVHVLQLKKQMRAFLAQRFKLGFWGSRLDSLEGVRNQNGATSVIENTF